MPTSNIEFQSMELPPTEQAQGFEAEMVGEGLIYAELGTAAFILAEAEAQYQVYVATLPQEEQDKLAQAEADLKVTDRPLNADFLTQSQSYDDDTRAKRAAAMQVRQNAWAGADIQADAVLQGAQERQIQYYRQTATDRIIRELIDNDSLGTNLVPSKRNKRKIRSLSDWLASTTSLPRAA